MVHPLHVAGLGAGAVFVQGEEELVGGAVEAGGEWEWWWWWWWGGGEEGVVDGDEAGWRVGWWGFWGGAGRGGGGTRPGVEEGDSVDGGVVVWDFGRRGCVGEVEDEGVFICDTVGIDVGACEVVAGLY